MQSHRKINERLTQRSVRFAKHLWNSPTRTPNSHEAWWDVTDHSSHIHEVINASLDASVKTA